MAHMLIFYLRVLFTLIMLVIFGFMIMYFVISVKLIRVSNKEENINKKRSAQKSLLWSVSGMMLVFFVWMIIMAYLKA
jgi:heme/copper-type cytochrome/quinol oxidase subunit 2